MKQERDKRHEEVRESSSRLSPDPEGDQWVDRGVYATITLMLLVLGSQVTQIVGCGSRRSEKVVPPSHQIKDLEKIPSPQPSASSKAIVSQIRSFPDVVDAESDLSDGGTMEESNMCDPKGADLVAVQKACQAMVERLLQLAPNATCSAGGGVSKTVRSAENICNVGLTSIHASAADKKYFGDRLAEVHEKARSIPGDDPSCGLDRERPQGNVLCFTSPEFDTDAEQEACQAAIVSGRRKRTESMHALDPANKCDLQREAVTLYDTAEIVCGGEYPSDAAYRDELQVSLVNCY